MDFGEVVTSFTYLKLVVAPADIVWSCTISWPGKKKYYIHPSQPPDCYVCNPLNRKIGRRYVDCIQQLGFDVASWPRFLTPKVGCF